MKLHGCSAWTSSVVSVEDLRRSQKLQGLQRRALTDGQIQGNKIALQTRLGLQERRIENGQARIIPRKRSSCANHLFNGRNMGSDGRLMWKEFMPRRGRRRSCVRIPTRCKGDHGFGGAVHQQHERHRGPAFQTFAGE